MSETKVITPVFSPQPLPPQVAPEPPDPQRLGASAEDQTFNPRSIPTRLTPANPALAQVSLGETGAHGTHLSKTDQFLLKTNWSWSKVMALVLALQGLYGLATSIRFVLVEYPMLEQKLAIHAVTQDEVNSFASQAIIIVTSTLLSMIFAIRLSIVKKAAKILHKVLTGILFLANAVIMRYLNQIGSAEIVNRFTTQLIDFVRQIL